MEDNDTDMGVMANISEYIAAGNISHCSYFNGDQHKCDTILIVKRVMASLSFIGCLFMIFIIWLFRKYIIFTQRLILYLSIAALFDCTALMMQGDVYEDTAWCNFQAWAVTFLDWCVFLWVMCITFNLFMLVTRNKRTEKYEWAYHALCWGFPFLVSLLPFIGNHYGPSGIWCWIVDDWAWRFFIWYIPLFIGIIGLFCVYMYITIHVQKKLKTWEGLYDPDVERKKTILQDDIKPLRGYPFVYLACSIFPLINRIQNAASPDPVFALVLLHAMSSPLQGFLNAIVFGLDKETLSKLNPSEMKMAYRSWRYRERSQIMEYPQYPEMQSSLPPDIDVSSAAGMPSGGSSSHLKDSAGAETGADYQGTTAATLRVNTVST